MIDNSFYESKSKEIKEFRNNESNSLQIDSYQKLQKFHEDNLDNINKLKSKSFESIISKIYISFDLREEYLDKNELNEKNISILTNLYNKFNGKMSSKEKKKKANKPNKDGLGLLLSLDISESSLLYHQYTIININKISFFECFLYSIHIPINNVCNNVGFIFPLNLGEYFQFKLLDRKKREISYSRIKKEKKIQFSYEQMEKILTYHYCICSQLLRGKKSFESDLIHSYIKYLNKSDIYKKYFFIPIKKNNNQIELDEYKLSRCINFLHENCPNELFPRISEIISTDGNKEENREKIFKLLEKSYIVTDYNINRLYKFEDIIYKDDKFDTFISRLSFNNNELSKELKMKFLEEFQKNKLDSNKITVKYIMEEIPFEENDVKSILGAVIGYKKIPQKYKVEVSNKYNYYLTCKFGSLNVIKKINYTYNINILKTSVSPSCKAKSEFSDIPQNDKEKYAKILPPDRIFSYYLDLNDVEFFEIIPSLFLNFEEIVKVQQFIKDYNLLSKKSAKEKKIIEKNYFFLQWAFTLHMFLQDYNYETLETLGDSILKMIATIIVYHLHEINDVETDVGELVFNRATLICNLHLFTKGLENKIYNYLIRYPKEITNYTFPLEHEYITTGRINISEKILADIVESSIGGIFLCTRNTKDCFNYIKKLDIPFVEKNDSKYEQSRGAFSKETIWRNNLNYNILVNKSYEEINKKMENIGEFIFPEKIIDIINNEKLTKNINFVELMENYILKCKEAYKKYGGDNQSLEYLQKCKLFYTFKNIKLLEQAMTHKSKDNQFSKNYEKLELLGDSIVESFIGQYTFCIFGPYLFEDDKDDSISNKKIRKKNIVSVNEDLIKKNAKEFNNKYMTHIKSYLCSNYFMCKLSILIGLPKYIKFGENDYNNKNHLNKFFEFKNVKGFFESNLNSYVSTEIFQPKFVADLFEALIGAIYVDSDLKTTYDFLQLIYGPSICYSCLYLKELPFSIVADFTERCSKEIKIVPSFKNVSKEEIINSGLNYDNNKVYLKLSIGDLFSCIDKGDNEEKARENLSEKGIIFLDNLKYEGPSKRN